MFRRIGAFRLGFRRTLRRPCWTRRRRWGVIMRKTELPPLMTIADTMAYLQCSRQHVYDLLAAGRIKTYKIGRRRYIDADSLAHLFW
ncbi:helix-turn-helix domain-containing protein [Bifidobacterium catenulatum]|uniref:helix-turn-helix domain-containing protein n=1 Tax=Bifidobacterium catenulatum TaxID=1686 RepID=UPI003BAB23CA